MSSRARKYQRPASHGPQPVNLAGRSRSDGTWLEQHSARLTPGERAADAVRNGMGSWAFVGAFVAFLTAWVVANTVLKSWDPFPYILLNLFLSMLAALQGAILLIAAKRQDAISAALAQHDFETDAMSESGIERLLELNRQQLQLLTALQERLDAVSRSD